MTESTLTTAQKQSIALQRQRARSLAIAISLAVLVALFYAATIVRMGNNGAPHFTADAGDKGAIAK